MADGCSYAAFLERLAHYLQSCAVHPYFVRSPPAWSQHYVPTLLGEIFTATVYFHRHSVLALVRALAQSGNFDDCPCFQKTIERIEQLSVLEVRTGEDKNLFVLQFHVLLSSRILWVNHCIRLRSSRIMVCLH